MTMIDAAATTGMPTAGGCAVAHAGAFVWIDDLDDDEEAPAGPADRLPRHRAAAEGRGSVRSDAARGADVPGPRAAADDAAALADAATVARLLTEWWRLVAAT